MILTTWIQNLEQGMNPHLKTVDHSLRESVYTEQIGTIYRINILTMPAMVLLIVLTIYLLNVLDTPSQTITLWASIIFCVVIARITATIFYRRKRTILKTYNWAILSASITMMFGLLWAMLPGYFLETDNLLSLAVVTSLVVGIGAASVTVAIYPPTFLSILLPVYSVMLYRCFLEGAPGSVEFSCGLLVLLGLVVHLAFGYEHYTNQLNSIRVQLKNRQLQRNAEEKTEFLETVLNNIQQGMVICDAQGKVQQVNDRFRQLLGLNGAINHIDDAKHLSIQQQNTSEIDTGNHHLVVDRVGLPDGGFVVTVTDVTTAKQRETDLERAKAEAESANAAKTRFLAAASHDLRQPVHALGLYFESLEKRVDSEQTQPLLQRVRESIDVVDQMLNSLLDISKLDAGVMQPNQQGVSVRDIFSRIEQEFRALTGISNTNLKVESTHHRIKTDPAMFDRILRNLMTNAIKAAPGGNVSLSAALENNEIIISVIDDGIGIESSHQEKIFQEFYQIHNPQRDRRHGLGLGLAIVSRLCKLLGHEIRMDSAPGEGTRFYLFVEQTQAAGSEKRPALDSMLLQEPVLLSDKSIVVIDDERSVLDSMQTVFDDWGASIVTAETAEEALEKLNGHNPDLVICDYRLRDNQTGYQAIEKLKGALHCEMPALIITGDTAPDRLVEARESGYDILYKPVRPVKLKTAVRRMLLAAESPSIFSSQQESIDSI